MKLQESIIKTKGKETKRYFLTIPAKIVKFCNWKKSQEFDIQLGEKGSIIIKELKA